MQGWPHIECLVYIGWQSCVRCAASEYCAHRDVNFEHPVTTVRRAGSRPQLAPGACATTLSALNRITLNVGATMPVVDDTIANAASIVAGTATGKVVSIDATNRYVYFLPSSDSVGNFASFSAANTVFVGSTSKGVISGGGVSGAYPEVSRNSGDIVYLENRGAVARAADQIEDIKLIIEM